VQGYTQTIADRPAEGIAEQLNPLEQARHTAALCQEKLATDVTILDMRGVCDFTDFFVIATGHN
jgi:hypothetical protein